MMLTFWFNIANVKYLTIQGNDWCLEVCSFLFGHLVWPKSDLFGQTFIFWLLFQALYYYVYTYAWIYIHMYVRMHKCFSRGVYVCSYIRIMLVIFTESGHPNKVLLVLAAKSKIGWGRKVCMFMSLLSCNIVFCVGRSKTKQYCICHKML